MLKCFPRFSLHYLTLIFPKTIQKFSSVAFNKSNIGLYEYSSEKVIPVASNGMKVAENFISTSEEEILLQDIEPRFKRLTYQKGHWDNAIQNYRETENVRWSKNSSSLISRMKVAAFQAEDQGKSSVHVLDLSDSGVIMPHVDSVKFCGRVICGLSLLSPCIMKFVNTNDSNMWFKTLLKRRSLYIMSDEVRYDFTHEILSGSNSSLHGHHIEKSRRVSILCRSEPQFQQSDDSNLFTSKVIPLD